MNNRLIYDDDLNITWYDYTKFPDTWQNQKDWAANLNVTFGGTNYSDWRLPTTPGTGNGFVAEGEMGHLFYAELGGVAGQSITSTHNANYSLFEHLQSGRYWSGTEWSLNPNGAWVFIYNQGYQLENGKVNTRYAMAVREGDVAIVPEPATYLLFGAGLSLIMLRSRIQGQSRLP